MTLPRDRHGGCLDRSRDELFRSAAVGGCANTPSVLAKPVCAGEVIPYLRGRNGNAEFGGYTSRGLFPPRREFAHGLPRLFEYRGWRGLGCAAVERRLRCISHMELDRLCDLVAAQLGGEPQRAVDAGGDAAAKTQAPSTTTRSLTGIAPKYGSR